MIKSRFFVLICFFCAWTFYGCVHSGTSIVSHSDFIWSVESGPINSGHYRCVALDDLDGDGFQDLVAGSFLPGGVMIWTGDGSGKWRIAPKPPVSGDVRAIAIGDLNGDGKKDLVIGGQRDMKGIMVLLQDVHGTWRFGHHPIEVGSYESIKCLDVNRDGHLDILAANSSGDQVGGIQVWFGDGKGDWLQQGGPDASHIYRDLDVADLDGDGNLDIVATSWGHPGGIRIFLGNGDGAWSTYPSPAKDGDFWGVAVSDLNNDGYLDIAATTYYRGIKLWQGNGKGDWQEILFPVDRGFYWDVLVSDFNQDGRKDLAASAVNSKGVRVWLGAKMSGWLSVEKGLPHTGGFYGLAISDLDGDKNPDLVAASYSEGVHAWLGGKGDARPVKKNQAVVAGQDEKSEPYLAVTRYGIPFEPNGLVISDAAKGVVSELIKRVKTAPYESIRIEGHTGSNEKPGESGSLMVLSEARADKIGKILTEKVVLNTRKVMLIGFADSKPIEGTMASMGVKNARVDVLITHIRSVDDELAPDEEQKKKQEMFLKNQSMSDYKVGAGDILKIVFWKQFSADEHEVLIRPDGTLSFSMVDDLKVSGLTVTELDSLMTKELSRYIKTPRIDVLVKEFHSQEVLLLGAVNSLIRQPTGPGVYILEKPTKIVEFLTIAGGPRPTANLKKVAVSRKNGTTLYVNLYKALFQSDASQNIQVFSGDSIFIPETSEGVSKVYVFGEVKTPGVYDLKEGMNVLEVIGKAGSFSPDAVIQSTRLIRGDLTNPEVIPVNLKRFFKTGDLSSNLNLQNNDIVYVPKTKIASLSHFLKNLKPALDFVLFPYQFEALRTTIDLNEENVRPLTP